MRTFVKTNCFGETEAFYTEAAANHWVQMAQDIVDSRKVRQAIKGSN